MRLWNKLFGRGQQTGRGPDIQFGRYSDNNKSPEKLHRWDAAETLFREQRYEAALDAFFDYLRDDRLQNVIVTRHEHQLEFEICQGSKIVRGHADDKQLVAEAALARMPQPSIPVMRQLLEMNFSLYYSRCALHDHTLCMRFDTEIATASPTKLYYGLKEMAIKADKQDDLLVDEFAALQPTDSNHIIELPETEKAVKYDYFRRWIDQGLELARSLNPDAHAAGIAYTLLALIYRIDYLIAPDGKLLYDLERLVNRYFIKDEKTVVEKNQQLMSGLETIAGRPEEDIKRYFYRTKATFSITSPQPHDKIADAIYKANQQMIFYRDNKLQEAARQITEYGIAFCQYSYSLPHPLTRLFHLYMQVNYPDFFSALGFNTRYYDPVSGRFNEDAICDSIKDIMDAAKDKYPKLLFHLEQLKFDNLLNFGHSFTTEAELLEFE